MIVYIVLVLLYTVLHNGCIMVRIKRLYFIFFSEDLRHLLSFVRVTKLRLP